MGIPVLEDHWYKMRCQAIYRREPGVVGWQCDDHVDHIGSHHHALDSTKLILWPSEDDIRDARDQAALDGMSQEEVMHTLTGGNPTNEEEIKEWAKASANFVLAGVRMQKEIGELKEKLAKVNEEYQQLRNKEPHG